MKKVSTFLLILSMFTLITSFETPKKEKINWLSMKEMQVAYKKQPKPVIIDVYTSWCGWCKVMDKETYNNDNVANYINKNYYAVKFDAESTAAITLGTKNYVFDRTQGVHELAIYLLFGQMSYPTTVLLSSIESRPAPIAGFLKPAELEAPIKYFGDKVDQKQDYKDYIKTFSAQWQTK